MHSPQNTRSEHRSKLLLPFGIRLPVVLVVFVFLLYYLFSYSSIDSISSSDSDMSSATIASSMIASAAKAAIFAAKKRILCFGDSLTAGYWAMGRRYSAPGNHLETLLNASASSSSSSSSASSSSIISPQSWSVEVSGVPGEETEQMIPRLIDRLETHNDNPSLSSPPYYLSVILGGSNDIAYSSSSIIFKNIQTLLNICLNSIPFVIVVTIPQMYAETNLKQVGEKRVEINNALINYVQKLKEENQKIQKIQRVFLVDLCKEIPNIGISQEERHKWWDDGIHFTVAGYKKFGELIYQTMKENGLMAKEMIQQAENIWKELQKEKPPVKNESKI